MALAQSRPLIYDTPTPPLVGGALSGSSGTVIGSLSGHSTSSFTATSTPGADFQSPSPFTDEVKPRGSPDTSVSPADLSPSSKPRDFGRSPSPLDAPDSHVGSLTSVCEASTPVEVGQMPTYSVSPGSASVSTSLGMVNGAGPFSATSVGTVVSGTNPLKKLRISTATGISTTIPVTGERPRPERHASLEDDVLYAIFEILHDRDPEAIGMTVKQVCDILIEHHPDMAKLSSKTSNLVSAKLNAYVKRVEKGEKSLIYALSRDWADASPKRMVYVYRGLLTSDYHLHVQALAESKKEDERKGNPLAAVAPSTGAKHITKDSFTPDDFRANGGKQRRATMYDIRPVKSSFLESPIDFRNHHFSGIPYSVAPVTAALGSSVMPMLQEQNEPSLGVTGTGDLEVDVSEVETSDYNDDDLDDDICAPLSRNKAKRSKSMSALANVKRPRPLTAAAAAPRIPRHAVSTAEHAAVLEALSPAESLLSISSAALSVSSIGSGSAVSQKWLTVVRSGFLTQDIETPEDISLSELDTLFA